MSDTPSSPRARRLPAPGWLDGRLVLGVLLVLVSVVVGARVLSAADRSTLVWAAGKDLTAGSQLSSADLQRVRVRLFDGLDTRYVPVDQDPAGLVLQRGMDGGDLLPRSALLSPQQDVDLRLVTVPVDGARFPPGLAADQQVDVWLTPEATVDPLGQAAAADPAGQPAGGAPPTIADPDASLSGGGVGVLPLTGAQPVLLRVPVESVQTAESGFAGGSTSVPVVLSVRPDEVARLVSALSLGRIDLVRVPQAAEQQTVFGGTGPG